MANDAWLDEEKEKEDWPDESELEAIENEKHEDEEENIEEKDTA